MPNLQLTAQPVSQQGDQQTSSLMDMLTTFRPGMSSLALRHHIELDEIISEGAIAFFDAESGFDPARGKFSRRWWFFLSKRITKMGPRRTDAMAHIDDTAFFEHGRRA